MVKKGGSTQKVDSEFQSYTYIKNELKELGWNTRNPTRDRKGQVYTQHECLHNPEIKSMLGQLVPEFVVKLAEGKLWVVEAKGTHEDIDTAYDEAVEYGKLINNHRVIRSMIVSGVAGNDVDRYIVRSGYWNERKKEFEIVVYEGKPITSLISPDLSRVLLQQDSPILIDYRVDEQKLLKAAKYINEVFYSASVKKENRATIVAAILLSLLKETEPGYGDTPEVFIDDINSRAESALKENRKGQFTDHLRIHPPEKPDAREKFKQALVTAMFVLKKINIRAAMRTGTDVLGKFYETFLQYGNGAKDLGIVLTPNNITEFSCRILQVNHNDIVYDPTCGTGGFLVSAFYQVMQNSTPAQLNVFKNYRILGIEQQASVASLAIVNMIFRGDGSTNIINDDCLARALKSHIIRGKGTAKFISKQYGEKISNNAPITKVLMNPPFALESKDEREVDFVQHALEQMEDGGVLFSILPHGALVRTGSDRTWRRDYLMKSHTLLGVIMLPDDTFYQQGSTAPTCGVIIKKGSPHPENQRVLWARILHDGYYKLKNKRFFDPNLPNQLEEIEDTVTRFIQNPRTRVPNKPELIKACKVDLSDNKCELSPAVYLDQKVPESSTLRSNIESIFRNMIAYLIVNRSDMNFKAFIPRLIKQGSIKHNNNYQLFRVTSLFNLDKGDFHAMRELIPGDIPTVSRLTTNQGVAGFYEMPEGARIHPRGLMTVSTTSGDAFIQTDDFLCTDNVVICVPKEPMRLTTLFFIQLMINKMKWRYSYGRQCYRGKFSKTEIYLPILQSGKIDHKYIEKLVSGCLGWDVISKYLE